MVNGFYYSPRTKYHGGGGAIFSVCLSVYQCGPVVRCQGGLFATRSELSSGRYASCVFTQEDFLVV